MTRDGWALVVDRAADDPTARELLIQLLTEQDAAKAVLTTRFGVTGQPWPELVDDVLDAASRRDHARRVPAEPIRFIDVDGWNAYKAKTGVDLHVYLDDEDVTARCFRAIFHDGDLFVGDVWLYRLNADGQKFYDRAAGKAAIEVRTGQLRIEPGAPLS